MNRRISINTIQELIDHRHTAMIYCHNPRCHHRAELDLKALRDRLGPDHTLLYEDVRYKFVCGRCGGREWGMINSPPTMERRG